MVISFCCLVSLPGQVRLLGRQDLMDLAAKGLDEMYDYRFSQAKETINEMKKQLPGHPVVPFMHGLVIYWENFPLTPKNREADTFLFLMNESIKKSREITDKTPRDVEGVFFDLVSQAMCMQYFADNGQPAKVLPYLWPSYRLLRIGFELDSIFPEFCFTTGLYQYYIVVYPEKYPVYKPIAAMFPAGNKQKGIELVERVTRESVFLKNEGMSFLYHLYLSFENNPSRAYEYISELVRRHPANSYYAVQQVNCLIAQGYYEAARPLVERLYTMPDKNPFILLSANLFNGILQERIDGRMEEATILYQNTLQQAVRFGDYANHQKAMAYMGLSRISFKKGEYRRSREYYRKARSLTGYDYIFNLK